MEKVITIYVLKTVDKSVNHSTLSSATKAQVVLKSFDIESKIEKVKKTFKL